MKTDLFQSYGHCWVFQIWYHIEYSTLTASSFRIWNMSTGISSSPLALFVVMLPKAHLTLDSRISGSRWVITPSWLPKLLRSYFYSSSVYSCHLFLISSASVRSIPFLSFIEIEPIFAWNFPLASLIFLKRYAENIMQNARLDELPAGIKISRRNINNFIYASDTTLMAESKEELKSLLMKWKRRVRKTT